MSTSSPSGQPRTSRGVWRVAAVAAAFSPLAGCFAMRPFESGVTSDGEVVQFELNDRGQGALGPRVGAEVRIVEGRVTAVSGSAFTVAVSKVVDRSNVPQTWTGEALEIDRGFVRSAEIRRLDRTRSALVAGGVAAAVFGFLATRQLIGRQSGSNDPRPPGSNNQ